MKQSGWGIASLVCGIAGILLACVAIGAVPAIIGLVCAVIAFTQKGKGHGTAIAGLICSIVAIIIFIFASLVFDGSDSDQPEKVESSPDVEASDDETEESTDSSDDYFTLGDSVETNDLIITFSSAKLTLDDVAYQSPDDGDAFMKLDFEFENISDEDQDISGYDFSAYADDYAVDYIDSTFDTTLSPGKKTKGSIYFEVPMDTKVFDTEYSTSYYGNSKVKFSIVAEE